MLCKTTSKIQGKALVGCADQRAAHLSRLMLLTLFIYMDVARRLG